MGKKKKRTKIRERFERTAPGIQTLRAVMPAKTTEYFWVFKQYTLHVCYAPWRGVWPISLIAVHGGRQEVLHRWPNWRNWGMKKITIAPAGDDEKPPLSSESKVLKAFPKLREFLTLKKYEDGSTRKPGRLWLEQDGVAFTITLKEPSMVALMRVRANEIDDVFTLAEAALKMDLPPWEIDQWAYDKLPKPKKKKSS